MYHWIYVIHHHVDLTRNATMANVHVCPNIMAIHTLAADLNVQSVPTVREIKYVSGRNV